MASSGRLLIKVQVQDGAANTEYALIVFSSAPVSSIRDSPALRTSFGELRLQSMTFAMLELQQPEARGKIIPGGPNHADSSAAGTERPLDETRTMEEEGVKKGSVVRMKVPQVQVKRGSVVPMPPQGGGADSRPAAAPLSASVLFPRVAPAPVPRAQGFSFFGAGQKPQFNLPKKATDAATTQTATVSTAAKTASANGAPAAPVKESAARPSAAVEKVQEPTRPLQPSNSSSSNRGLQAEMPRPSVPTPGQPAAAKVDSGRNDAAQGSSSSNSSSTSPADAAADFSRLSDASLSSQLASALEDEEVSSVDELSTELVDRGERVRRLEQELQALELGSPRKATKQTKFNEERAILQRLQACDAMRLEVERRKAVTAEASGAAATNAAASANLALLSSLKEQLSTAVVQLDLDSADDIPARLQEMEKQRVKLVAANKPKALEKLKGEMAALTDAQAISDKIRELTTGSTKPSKQSAPGPPRGGLSRAASLAKPLPVVASLPPAPVAKASAPEPKFIVEPTGASSSSAGSKTPLGNASFFGGRTADPFDGLTILPASAEARAQLDQRAMRGLCAELEALIAKLNWSRRQPASSSAIATELACMLQLRVLQELPAWAGSNLARSPSTMSPSATSMHAVLLRLKGRMQAESLVNKFGSQLNAVYTALQACVTDGNASFAPATSAAQTLLRALQCFDTYDFLTLLSAQQEAMAEIDQRCIQDIVLLIGKTGSGKSTATHFLAGSSMHEVTNGDVFHICPKIDGVRNPHLRRVHMSASGKSETRFLSPVVVRHEEDLGIVGSKETTTLVDAPGFGDTAGAEVDVSNGIGIISMLRQSKSVKVLMLLNSSDVGAKGQGIAETLDVLSAMLPSLLQHLDSVVFAFTPYDEWKRGKAHGKLRTALNKVEELGNVLSSTDQTLASVLKHLLQAGRLSTTGQEYVLNPIHPDGLVEARRFLLTVHNAPPIRHSAADSKFFFFITEQSKTVLLRHVTQLHREIHLALERREIDLVRARMVELQSLLQCQQPLAVQQFEACQTAVLEWTVSIYSAMELLLRPGAFLSESEITRLTGAVRDLQLTDSIADMLPPGRRQADHLLLLLEKQVAPQIAAVDKCVAAAGAYAVTPKQAAEGGTSLRVPLLPADITRVLDQCRSLHIGLSAVSGNGPHATALKNLYPQLLTQLQQYMRFVGEAGRQSLSSLCFPMLAEELDVLRELQVPAIQRHWSESGSIAADVYQLLADGIQTFLQQLLTQAWESVPEVLTDLLSEEQLEQLMMCQQSLESARQCSHLHMHVQLVDLMHLCTSFSESAVSRCRAAVQESESSSSFDTQERVICQLQQLQRIKGIDSDIAPMLYTVQGRAAELVREARARAEDKLRTLKQHTSPDWSEMRCVVEALPQDKWIQLLAPLPYEDACVAILTGILDFAQLLVTQLQTFDLTLTTRSSECEQAMRVRAQLDALAPIEEFVPGLQDVREECNARVEEKVIRWAEMVRKHFTPATSEWRADEVQQALALHERLVAIPGQTAQAALSEAVKQMHAFVGAHAASEHAAVTELLQLLRAAAATSAGTPDPEQWGRGQSMCFRLHCVEEMHGQAPLVAAAFDAPTFLQHFSGMLVTALQVTASDVERLQQQLVSSAPQAADQQSFECLLASVHALTQLDAFLPPNSGTSFTQLHGQAKARQAEAAGGLLRGILSDLRESRLAGAVDSLASLELKVKLAGAGVDQGSEYVLRCGTQALQTCVTDLLNDVSSRLMLLTAPITLPATVALVEPLQKLKANHEMISKRMTAEVQAQLRMLLSLDPADSSPLQARLHAAFQGSFVMADKATLNEELLAAATIVENARECLQVALPFCSQAVIQVCNGSSGQLEAKLHATTQHFAAVALSHYADDSPWPFFRRLASVAAAFPSYQPHVDSLLGHLVASFRDQLARSALVSVGEGDKLHNDCLAAVDDFPQGLQAGLMAEAKATKEKRANANVAAMEEAKKATAQLDAAAILALFESYPSDGSMEFAATCLRESVEVRVLECRKLVMDATTHMMDEPADAMDTLRDIVPVVVKLDRCKTTLTKHVAQLGPWCDEAITFFFSAFATACLELGKLLQPGQPRDAARVRLMECQWSVFGAFVSAAAEPRGGIQFPPRDVEDASACMVAMKDFLQQQAASFDQALAESDCQLVKDAINEAKRSTQLHAAVAKLVQRLPVQADPAVIARFVSPLTLSALHTLVNAGEFQFASMDGRATVWLQQIEAAARPACNTTVVFNSVQPSFEKEHKDLAVKLQLLQDAHAALGDIVPAAATNQRKELETQLIAKVSRLVSDTIRAESSIQTEGADEASQKPLFQQLCLAHSFLDSLATHVNLDGYDARRQVVTIEAAVLQRVATLLTAGTDAANSTPVQHDRVAQALIQTMMLATQLGWMTHKVQSAMDRAMESWLASGMAVAELKELHAILKADPSGNGSRVVQRSKFFTALRVAGRNQKVQAQKVDTIILSEEFHDPTLPPAASGHKGTNIDVSLLSNRYVSFDSLYLHLIAKHMHTKNVAPLVQEIKKIAAESGAVEAAVKSRAARAQSGLSGQAGSGITWWDKGLTSNTVPQLLARIFAVWSIEQSKDFIPDEESSGQQSFASSSSGPTSSTAPFDPSKPPPLSSFVVRPHAAQVIAIFRLLGVGDAVNGETLRNHMVQIGTGEGKSVTLAITAIVLSLLGANVACACYSAYLSLRDKNSFLSLFQLLGVEHLIFYGTFEKVCERWINDAAGREIRPAVTDLCLQRGEDQQAAAAASSAASLSGRPQVLLVDEVDVFFSESFYGASYTPMAPIEHPAFTALVKDVWREYTAVTPRRSPRLAEWQQRDSFLACLAALPHLAAQLQETLKDLLTDVTQFAAEPYTVSSGLIAYAENDGFTTDARFGYRTMFAALCEFDAKTITSDTADSYCRLNLLCGHFSFADLPLQFDFILGASGTLATLSQAEKRIVTDVYKLCAQTYIPSTFGSSKLKFLTERPLQMTNMAARHSTLCTEITNRLISTDPAVKSKRAVIVFFESIEELNAFATSAAFQAEPYGNTQCIVTEHTKPHEKEVHFNNATSPGNVALMTRSFGRGTDFLTHHPAMATNGGVHVICTFLPPSMAEETQIRGRTARQSDPGSFSLVLPVEKMELFAIESAKYDEKKKDPQLLYEYLDGMRKQFYERQYQNRSDVVAAAKKEHDASMAFLADLRAGASRSQSIFSFLLSRNLGPAMKRQSRTLLCFDATYSMQDLLSQTKLTIGDTFERAGEVLRQHGMDDQGFALQLCAYRNYNVSAEQVLEHSAYDNRPQVLRDFLSRISIAGGWGNEALELALWHAANEVEAAGRAGEEADTQVIFVGDAPAQSMDEVLTKRGCVDGASGEPYWARTRFATPTEWRSQLQRLIALHIPVHAFWLATRARSQFEEMSRLSGGSCHPLDVSSPASAAQLTDLLTMAVLKSVGGAAKGDDLVATYKKTYRAHV